MELLRRDADYALRAATVLARAKRGQLLSARRIAGVEGLAEPLLRKLLQRLARAGVVRSAMGKRGGFRLARDPARITALEVVEAVQGPLAVNLCFHAPGRCPIYKTCTMRDKMRPVQAKVRSMLKGIVLKDLANGAGKAAAAG